MLGEGLIKEMEPWIAGLDVASKEAVPAQGRGFIAGEVDPSAEVLIGGAIPDFLPIHSLGNLELIR